MNEINQDDIRLAYPGFYNIYSIRNEISIHSMRLPTDDLPQHQNSYLLDDHYGRVLQSNVSMPYAHSDAIDFYVRDFDADIVDVLRVPFRKIPVYRFTDVHQIEKLANKLKDENEGYTVLLRGQTKFYPIKRDAEEFMFLYGENAPKEPSFHPSFLRSKFNDFFIYNLWHAQVANMLHDIGVDLSGFLPEVKIKEYYADVDKIKGSPHFTPLALGIAQHYGLPSIGLDLTKDVKVACWFASHELKTGDKGVTSAPPLVDFKESTIYFFRCPADAVFSHQHVKPKFVENTRPDRQDAWFCHAGWGFAKNQLGSYLMAAIRLDESILSIFKDGYDHHLFPGREEDLMLNFFLDMRENDSQKGEVARALERIYLLGT
ncbi:MAG: FRG domain-containing protein [Chitinophagaceae bacterium]|nr:FRG domain-containing protein [Chitinophagaceae bacterium]